MDRQKANNIANIGERSLWARNARDQRRVCECGIAQLKGNRRRWKIPWRRFPRKGTRTRKTKAIPKASETRTRHRLRWSGRPDALTHTHTDARSTNSWRVSRLANVKMMISEIGLDLEWNAILPRRPGLSFRHRYYSYRHRDDGGA